MNNAFTPLNWDYEVLGSIGYHKVGQPDAIEKRTIENGMLRDIARLPQFIVPAQLTDYARTTIKRFTHEAGTYDELCVVYDWIALEHWELSDNAQENHKAAVFYTWLDTMQCYDYEHAKIIARCHTIYEQRNGCTLPCAKQNYNTAAI